MTFALCRDEAKLFFERYREVFNRLDGHAVADCWHVPSSIADSRGAGGEPRVTVYADDAALRANMHALCEVYRHNGFEACEFTLVEHVPLGTQHAFTLVHWILKRADGSCLQSFHTGYQLARTATGVRVLMAVAFEESINEMTPHAAA